MRTRLVLLAVIVLIGVRSFAAKPTPCADGRFALPIGAAPLVPSATTNPDVVTLAGGEVAIESGCTSTPAKVKAKKRGTRIAAKWTQCGSTEKTRLRATLPADACDQMTGTFRGRGLAKVQFEATRMPAVAGLNALYTLRDDIMAGSPRGQHFADLYEQFRTEMVAWLMHEEGLLDFGMPALASWMPLIESLVNGTASGAIITTDHVASLEEFFARLAVPASPDLQAAIAAETTAIGPLSRFVGMSMTEALAAIEAVPVATTTTPRTGGGGLGIPTCPATCLLGLLCTY